MNTLKLLALALLLGGPALAYADSTQPENIGMVKVDGDDSTVYVVATDNAWRAGGCTSVRYVYFRPSHVQNMSAIVSAILTAKAANLTVSFSGTCDSSYYFKATELFIH